MASDPLKAAKARLVAVCEELDAHRSDSSGLQEERRALVVKLRAAGVKRTEIADLARCSVDLVKSMTRTPAKRSTRKAATG